MNYIKIYKVVSENRLGVSLGVGRRAAVVVVGFTVVMVGLLVAVLGTHYSMPVLKIRTKGERGGACK